MFAANNPKAYRVFIQSFLGVLIAILLSLTACANEVQGEGGLGDVGLKATDSSGCYLSDERENVAGSTIGLMVAMYGSNSLLDDEIILKTINQAVKSGCNIEEPDSMGLSPLNAAILFNSPELVSFLLSLGANPTNAITSQKQSLNGLNSFQFVEQLDKKQSNWSAVKAVLAEYKKDL